MIKVSEKRLSSFWKQGHRVVGWSQAYLRRQKRSKIDRASALTIVIALLHLEALHPETVTFMKECLAEDTTEWNRSELLTLNAIDGIMTIQVCLSVKSL